MNVKKDRSILFVLDENSSLPLYQQISNQARTAISQKRIAPGEHLPSIRRLAAELKVSHTTVEQAYLQLSIEGYVSNIPRSGYVVEKLDTEYLSLPKQRLEPQVRKAQESRNHDAFFAENIQGGKLNYDFSYANLPSDSFPVKIWRHLVSEILYANTAPEFTRYSYADEIHELNLELAGYLGRARGLNCFPEQVLIQAGTDGSLATLFQLFDRDKHAIGMEEPGYATVHEVARRHGFSLVPLPTDQGIDAFIAALYRHNPKIVFTTPSHQFPTGSILSLDGRTQLIKWAQQNNSYIIEDDSCNEYRYDTSPIPSLQSLDAYNRVIYLCNVSKVLSPSMRLAYLVLPPKLLGRYYKLFNMAHPSVSLFEQEILARFIKEGYWEQHIRKMAVNNRKRHAVLLKSLTEQFGDRISISGINSGNHLYVTVHNSMTQEELMKSANENGAAVYGTKRFWFSKPAPENKVMIGFASIPIEKIPAGVEALKRAWF